MVGAVDAQGYAKGHHRQAQRRRKGGVGRSGGDEAAGRRRRRHSAACAADTRGAARLAEGRSRQVVADDQGGGRQAGVGCAMGRWLAGVALLLAFAGGAPAEDYPARPITVIVPFSAGGPTDSIIRNLAERMRVSLGQPLVVEYVTGAGGTVGTTRAARAAPDGYTIICGHVGTFVTNGAVYSLPFDLVTDFAPISLLPSNPYLIVAQKNLPPSNLREFMADLK